ncbi:MAG: sortase [Oscillospiraceae bacterium]|nr:sortase [Oscillospiraceae bacterium]
MKAKAKTLLSLTFVILMFLSFTAFRLVVSEPLTFFELGQNPEATMLKYAPYLEDDTITHAPRRSLFYTDGEVVGYLTLPALSMYERPIYYGANSINTNWQITTSGYSGGWDLFGDPGVANIGAHNYQLFSNLPTLAEGDIVLVETEDGVYIYEVSGTAIYDADTDDWDEVAYRACPAGSVVLMTCWPVDAVETEDRYLVYTQLVSGTLFDL